MANDTIVIEHDYDGHFRYDRVPTAALQALAPEHVAYVGTASAILVPTIRLGWSILPSRLVEQLAGATARNVFALPRLEQLALAEFIASGYLDRQLRQARSAYKKRRELVTATLRVRGTPGGLFVCVPLEPTADEARVLATVRQQGFALDGVQANAIGPAEPGLVIGFAALLRPHTTPSADGSFARCSDTPLPRQHLSLPGCLYRGSRRPRVCSGRETERRASTDGCGVGLLRHDAEAARHVNRAGRCAERVGSGEFRPYRPRAMRLVPSRCAGMPVGAEHALRARGAAADRGTGADGSRRACRRP